MTRAPVEVEWRTHQRRALEAVDADAARKHAGGRAVRHWVVLPPGSGKTYLGLGVVRAALAADPSTCVVVMVPTTAVQGQWLRAAGAFGLEAGSERSLEPGLHVVTFPSVAQMVSPLGDLDPAVLAGADVEDDPPDLPDEVDGIADSEIEARLHWRGSDWVARLAEVPRVLLVLDESHHLVQAWGGLLVELLRHLPGARTLALTGTPRDGLSLARERAVHDLFGETAYAAGPTDLVREGDLAPYLDLAWFTTPTAAEHDWLAEGGVRFAELEALLEAPDFGSTSLRAWLTARYVEPTRAERGRMSWSALAAAEPALTDAVLALVHVGVLDEPAGARRDNRWPPTPADWMVLLDDWLLRCVVPSDDPRDAEVLEVVRRTLPALGWVWTRRGVRRGRDMVDRVLARSEAKTLACREIVGHTLAVLGPRMRMLVVTDHESAASTVPMTLRGVVDGKAGSAWSVLDVLASDPATDLLDPILLTARTVAGTPAAMDRLLAFVAGRDPDLAASLRVEPVADGAPEAGSVPLARLVGERSWGPRRWVAEVTAYLSEGHSQLLVGTRNLLGEGWDARRVTGVIDLTTPTTAQSVTQVRGRSLRTDPDWSDKVAVNWTVCCVEADHPRGATDWERLVAKHAAYPALSAARRVTVGVGALDVALRPDRMPRPDELAGLNARARDRAADLAVVREAWAGGAVAPLVAPYPRAAARGSSVDPGLRAFETPRTTPPELPAIAVQRRVPPARVAWVRARARHGDAALAFRRQVPALQHVAGAVAAASIEALCEDGLSGFDALAARWADLVVLPDGSYRPRLRNVGPETAEAYETSVAEALGPLDLATHLVEVRRIAAAPSGGDSLRVRRAAARGRLPAPDPHLSDWYAVPSRFSESEGGRASYGRAWAAWTGGSAEMVPVESPEGAAVLASHATGPDAIGGAR
ncbi:DEAD/DEAH box helicase family protein [Nocardioides zeae]|uniref:DEAD/DEAH box helicase family protein n=1 Tax=Nocardioides imazamoxiresistens TaxID=3231893 RepID=A0ABU3Q097_9ACTN|nr:DEAD/DEAH box helicase family protein [Nocardioides zeae]MDT9594932.1 DEAD/DEAH box helicase family protein [Nocardioides zeae]